MMRSQATSVRRTAAAMAARASNTASTATSRALRVLTESTATKPATKIAARATGAPRPVRTIVTRRRAPAPLASTPPAQRQTCAGLRFSSTNARPTVAIMTARKATIANVFFRPATN